MVLNGSYTFTENEKSIKVHIDVKTVAKHDIVIDVSSKALKVNYTPYLIDLLLKHEVDAGKHRATMNGKILTITLFKTTPGLWGTLSSQSNVNGENTSITTDVVIRKQLQEEEQLQQQAQVAALKQKRQDDERFALRQQMAIDEAERQSIDDIKNKEKQDAEDAVYAQLARVEAEARKQQDMQHASTRKTRLDIVHEQEENDEETDDNNDNDDEIKQQQEDKSNVFEVVDHDNGVVDLSRPSHSKGKSHQQQQPLPQPRSQSKVAIEFSPRLFPTPLRESKVAQEQDWVSKNRKHIHTHGVLGKHANTKNTRTNNPVTEDDPTWLKAKGDDFYRGHDYLSAISAYSSAIDMLEELQEELKQNVDNHELFDHSIFLSVLSNRSNCYFLLGNYESCVKDCHSALTLFQSDLQQDKACESYLFNNPNMIKLFISVSLRRGVASCHNTQYSQAHKDYNSVLTLLKEIQRSVVVVNGKADDNQQNSDEEQFSKEQINHFDIGVRNLLLQQYNLDSLAVDVQNIATLEKVQTLKKDGDSLLSDSGHIQAAIEKYSDALSAFPLHVGSLSNRAIGYMIEGQFKECIEDCNKALSIMNSLQTFNADNVQSKNIFGDALSLNTSNGTVLTSSPLNILSSILPIGNKQKFNEWMVKTYCRRALAHLQLNDASEEALNDFQAALMLDPSNKELRQDVENLEKRIVVVVAGNTADNGACDSPGE